MYAFAGRDGASLLQKYLIEINDAAADGSLVFKGSSVYSVSVRRCVRLARKTLIEHISCLVLGRKAQKRFFHDQGACSGR